MPAAHRESGPEIVVCSTHDQFRRHAKRCAAADHVLEIGCSFGLATRALAKTGATVLAVDLSWECVRRAQEFLAGYPNASVAKLDGRDVDAIRALMPRPDVVFLDVGGDALLGNVGSMLRLCLRAFAPRLLVIRSVELAWVCDRARTVQLPATTRRMARLARRMGDTLEHVADLAQSHTVSDRVFAARTLKRMQTADARALLETLAADPDRRVRRIAGGSAPPCSGPPQHQEAER